MTSNNTPLSDQHNPNLHSILNSIYCSLILICLCAYAILVKSFCTNIRKQHYCRLSCYYRLLYNLSVADIGRLGTQLVALSGTIPASRETAYNVLAIMDSICFYSRLFLSLGIAADRFCVFVIRRQVSAPKPTSRCDPWRLTSVLVLLWSSAFLLSVVPNLVGCPKAFQTERHHFAFSCQVIPTHKIAAGVHIHLIILLELTSALAITTMYSVIFIAVRRSNRTIASSLSSVQTVTLPSDRARRCSMADVQRRRQRTAQEHRVLLQSVLICALLLLEMTAFFLFSGWLYGVPVNLLIIVNSGANPFILFACSEKIRGEIARSVRRY